MTPVTEPRQSHVTTGIVDRLSDGSYMLKPLKQKQYIDGLVFLLQEIYGIENKLVDNKVLPDCCLGKLVSMESVLCDFV